MILVLHCSSMSEWWKNCRRTRTQTVLERKNKHTGLWVWRACSFISTCFKKLLFRFLLFLADGGYKHTGFPSLCTRTLSLKPKEKKQIKDLCCIEISFQKSSVWSFILKSFFLCVCVNGKIGGQRQVYITPFPKKLSYNLCKSLF